MSQDTDVRAADPMLGRLAEAILIPPFPGLSAPGWMLDALGRGLAGVTLFGQNISAPDQVSALTAMLRSAAPGDDPVIAIDEEGGDVTRVAYADGSPYPGNAALGAVDDVALTQAVYRAIGADLAALGINFDLAPCADVLGTADSPAVGTRSFGADTGLVSRHTAAAVAGLQGACVAACTKHFPGHGRTGTDSHEAIATIEGGLADLRLVDLPPFEAAIRAGTLAIMPSHLRVPELTGDLPATVSAAAITGLLRGELGFTGVIVSDALEMRATRDTFGIPGAAVLAVAAGTDLLCLGRDGSEDDYLAVRDALVAAVREGALDGERLEEAADRVARLRGGLARTRSAAPAGDSPGPGVGLGIGPAADLAVGSAVRPMAGPAVGLVAARRAVRVSGPHRTLSHPVIIEVEPRENIAAGRFGWGLAPWAPAGSVHRVSASGRLLNGAGLGLADAARSGPADGDPADGDPADGGPADADQADGDRVDGGPADGGRVDAAGILAAAAGRSLVAVVRDAHRDEQTRSLVSALLAARPDLILVEMGLPFWRPPEGTSYLATYGASRASAHAAAELLGLTPA
ncbi:MAG TPA: glycoside hydrolase family 3 N-terminal domain-containing protein [Streptosporangiaceae bacterium]|nr:glycoside hydrolase family 3 N-terminal domain-containing protein [Streptosporangiaceae bacterium]